MDGLPALDANEKSFFPDDDGSVWFGADSSIIHVLAPDDLLHPANAPPVFVSSVSADDGSVKLDVDRLQNGNTVVHIGSPQSTAEGRSASDTECCQSNRLGWTPVVWICHSDVCAGAITRSKCSRGFS
jgi:hypothetical protein